MVTTTRYLYFGNQLVGETDETGTVTRTYTNEPDDYTHPIGHTDVATGESSYYHYDGQGNTRAVTDENENVTDTFTYDSWGNLLSRTGMTNVPFQFGGEHGYYRDEELDTYYVMARVYDPSIIRWRTVDPLGLIDGMNPYQYTHNNPIVRFDPSGMLFVGYNTFSHGCAGARTPPPIWHKTTCTSMFGDQAARDCQGHLRLAHTVLCNFCYNAYAPNRLAVKNCIFDGLLAELIEIHSITFVIPGGVLSGCVCTCWLHLR